MMLTTHYSETSMGSPPPLYRANALATAQLLEAVGVILGAPPRITSGYRSPAKNATVADASSTSCHLLAKAVDAVPVGMSLFEAATRLTVAEAQGRMPDYGELLYYAPRGHFHLTLPGCGGQRERLITLTGGAPWLPVNPDTLAKLPGATVGSAVAIVLALAAALLATKKG